MPLYIRIILLFGIPYVRLERWAIGLFGFDYDPSGFTIVRKEAPKTLALRDPDPNL